MPSGSRTTSLHPHMRAVMDETGQHDSFAAVRAKAQSVGEQYHRLFGEEPPFNLDALASMRGLRLTDDAPRHSEHSEIAPEADGRVVLRLNRDRPHTRQRFSIGHEVGQILFPDYQVKLRCRKAIDRQCTNHIRSDQSVPSEGPIFDASANQTCCDGEAWLDLGSVHGRFTVHALPVYTPAQSLGPTGDCSVVAILSPGERISPQ